MVEKAKNGHEKNSGMASDFPFKYTNAVIIGNNLCGTFVAVVSILAAFGGFQSFS